MPESALPTHDRAVRIIRKRARTFYLSSLFLPAGIRRDVHCFYAYYRLIDDLVDESPHGWTRDDVQYELLTWEEAILGSGPVHDPIAAEVTRIVDRHNVPPAYVLMVLEGARYDLDLKWVATRDDLRRYSVQVAGSVGMVMTYILGSADQQAVEAARSLGVAMQITNVLRDVGEDLDRGRIYLPRADLEQAGCTRESLHLRQQTAGLVMVMRDLMAEARVLYAEGMAGIDYLDPAAQFSVRLAASLYSRILDKIERQNFNVFDRRAHPGTVEKWMLTVPAYMQHRMAITGR